jgi:hypothetical protein
MRHHLAVAVIAALIPATGHAEPPLAHPAPAAALAPVAAVPRSPALAATFEILSPLGGAGCLYRRRYALGALVMAASLISGGMMIHGLAHLKPATGDTRGDGDEVSLNAVAYGVSRFIGLVGAARPDDAPAPRSATSTGLAHVFSF